MDIPNAARFADAFHIHCYHTIPQTTGDGTCEGSATVDTEATDFTAGRATGDRLPRLNAYHTKLAPASDKNAQRIWIIMRPLDRDDVTPRTLKFSRQSISRRPSD